MRVDLKRDPNCSLCRLHKTAQWVCMLGTGPAPCDVMIIGEAPGASEDARGQPFVGKSGQYLEQVLNENGFDRSDVFIANAVSCRPPDNRQPTKAEIKSCKTWLDYQIDKVKPKFILLLGNTPLQSITGSAGIRSKRGRPFERDGIIYMPTYHPAYILRDPNHAATFETDIRNFAEIVATGKVPREENVNPVIVRTQADVGLMLEALKGFVSYDIETTCLYPWQKFDPADFAKGIKTPAPAKIISIGFGTKDGEFILPIDHYASPWSTEQVADIVHQIDERLPECLMISHNGKFDYLWTWVHLGVKWQMHHAFDTMLAHYMIDENDLHGLKYLARRFFGAPDWEIDKDEKQGNAPIETIALYQAHDLYYTRKLYFHLIKMLKREPDVYWVFQNVMMPCAELFVEVEYDGVYIEDSQFAEAEEYLRGELDKALDELKQWEPEWFDKRGRKVDFNWGSPKQLAHLLFEELSIPIVERTKGGAASCSESVIKRIDHPCAGALLRFREAKQQLSFFIEGWKPYLHRRRVGGEWRYFLHPSFKLHGTVTGRLSCEHPNLQQVPRDPRIRSLISAEPGWVLVECDLSQIELRIAAELANERAMIWAFNNGVDIHWLTTIREIERGAGLKDLVLDTARTWKQDKSLNYAQSLEALIEMGPDAAAEINFEWKEYRKKAKAVNFGYLYGMWWKKFKMYARDNYGVTIDDDGARASRQFFFEAYPDLESWHKRQRRYVRQNGFVSSLSGRKRRLTQAMMREDTVERRGAERQAINSPVQSFANELNLMAALQLRHEFSRDVVRICGTVHDATLFKVRIDMVDTVVPRMLKIMSWPSLLTDRGIRLRVPIEAEAKIGPWGKGVSLDKWRASRNVK